VVRDRLSQVVESTPLEPDADLRGALTAAREARIAEGWACEEIGPCVAFFFCSRTGVREMVPSHGDHREMPAAGDREGMVRLTRIRSRVRRIRVARN
jgi:hypothetical protein